MEHVIDIQYVLKFMVCSAFSSQLNHTVLHMEVDRVS